MLPLNVQEALAHIRGNQTRLSANDAGLIFVLREEEPFRSYLEWAGKWVLHCYRTQKYYRSKNLQRTVSENESPHAIANPAGWASPAMLPAIMMLAARGLKTPGEVFIEAGVFKGGAASCLSPLCREVGIQYIAADTFAGLPWDGNDNIYYKGQFCGTLEEVKANLRNNGAYDDVEFAVGLFSETLPNVKRPIAGMFIDTDLYESSRSAIEAVKDYLNPDSIIFVDGIIQRDFTDGIFNPRLPEAKGVVDALSASGIKYTMQHTYLGNMGNLRIENEKHPFIQDYSISTTYNSEFFFSFYSLLHLHLSSRGKEVFNPFKEAIACKNMTGLDCFAGGMLFNIIRRYISLPL